MALKRSSLRAPLGALTTAAIALSALVLGGCPGTLDDKDKYGTGAGTGTGTGTGTGGGGGPSGCADVPTYFAQTCAVSAGCHSSQSPAAGLVLDASGLGEIVGKQAVGSCMSALADPANPTDSVLYLKLAGQDCGSQMPLGGTPPDDAQLACVAAWIAGLQGGSPSGGAGGAGGAGGGQ